MLTKIGDDGKTWSVHSVPHQAEYEQRKRKLNLGEFEAIYSFLESDLNEDKFSVGTKYPDTSEAWRSPLNALYYAMNEDEKEAGFFLGLIMMDVIIHHDEEWFCTKSEMIKRDFATMFYFKKLIH